MQLSTCSSCSKGESCWDAISCYKYNEQMYSLLFMLNVIGDDVRNLCVSLEVGVVCRVLFIGIKFFDQTRRDTTCFQSLFCTTKFKRDSLQRKFKMFFKKTQQYLAVKYQHITMFLLQVCVWDRKQWHNSAVLQKMNGPWGPWEVRIRWLTIAE